MLHEHARAPAKQQPAVTPIISTAVSERSNTALWKTILHFRARWLLTSWVWPPLHRAD